MLPPDFPLPCPEAEDWLAVSSGLSSGFFASPRVGHATGFTPTNALAPPSVAGLPQAGFEGSSTAAAFLTVSEASLPAAATVSTTAVASARLSPSVAGVSVGAAAGASSLTAAFPLPPLTMLAHADISIRVRDCVSSTYAREFQTNARRSTTRQSSVLLFSLPKFLLLERKPLKFPKVYPILV